MSRNSNGSTIGSIETMNKNINIKHLSFIIPHIIILELHPNLDLMNNPYTIHLAGFQKT